MNKNLLYCLAAGLTLLLCSPVLGQARAVDSTLVLARQAATAAYLEAVALESHVYNGPEYLNYDLSYMQGHQFFRDDEEVPGEIWYGGVRYAGVPLRYDIHRDQLVLTHPTSALMLQLINEQVQGFTIHGATFIRLHKDSLAAGTGKTGFYQVLADGPVKLLARRYKDMQETTTREGMTGEFRAIDRFFLLQDNNLVPVKRKKDMFKALASQRKALQQLVAAEKLAFGRNRNREGSLVALTRRYNELVK
jgi:hypothetical protein